MRSRESAGAAIARLLRSAELRIAASSSTPTMPHCRIVVAGGAGRASAAIALTLISSSRYSCQRSMYGRSSSRSERLHFLVEVRLALEPNARQVGHRDMALLDFHPIRKSAKRLKQVRVGLVAAEAEARCDIERHLMAPVRNAARRRPTVLAQHLQRAEIFDEPVAQGTIELQPVSVRTHSAVADEIARVLHGKQVFACRHRLVVVIAQNRLQLEIQRIAGLLVPEQIILGERLSVGDGGIQIETAVGVHT